MIDAKKEEANRLILEKQKVEGNKFNVMDIEVNEDFNLEEI
jgi:hypothetical protein